MFVVSFNEVLELYERISFDFDFVTKTGNGDDKGNDDYLVDCLYLFFILVYILDFINFSKIRYFDKSIHESTNC